MRQSFGASRVLAVAVAWAVTILIPALLPADECSTCACQDDCRPRLGRRLLLNTAGKCRRLWWQEEEKKPPWPRFHPVPTRPVFSPYGEIVPAEGTPLVEPVPADPANGEIEPPLPPFDEGRREPRDTNAADRLTHRPRPGAIAPERLPPVVADELPWETSDPEPSNQDGRRGATRRPRRLRTMR